MKVEGALYENPLYRAWLDGLALLRFAVADQLLVSVLAGNPWALHAAATLPGWRAFAESARR